MIYKKYLHIRDIIKKGCSSHLQPKTIYIYKATPKVLYVLYCLFIIPQEIKKSQEKGVKNMKISVLQENKINGFELLEKLIKMGFVYVREVL